MQSRTACEIAPPPRRLVRPVPLDPTGQAGPTRGQARGSRWRQSSHGFYVPAGVDDELPEQRILEQSLRLPDGGAVTGWAAGRLHGAGYLDGLGRDGRTRLPVPLVLGSSATIRDDERVVLLRGRLPQEETVVVHGIPCTRPERAAFDAVRLAPDLVEAVVALEMLFLGEVTSPRRVAAYARTRTGAKGLPLLLRALNFADEHSWSPNETRTKMVWRVDAGLPRPLVNQPIFDRRGRLLGYPDLLDVESGLVLEYDGADHRRAARHSSDVGREDVFRRHGLEVTHVTGPDLWVDDRVRRRILAARKRALWLPEPRRLWTVTPPPGWEPGPTLDMRLDQRDALRQLES